ncbi:MAG: hypothetical protein LUD47_05375 [Clostridia bacterium]|nr:hypothetical protein [Clostridia bacterium]
MKVKEILTAFWRYAKSYDGDISCKKTEERNGYSFYSIQTDKFEYLAAVEDKADRRFVFFSLAGTGEWQTSDKLAAYVDDEGLPRLQDGDVSVKTAPQLAAESGKSVATVYKLAKTLGRLPTVEELQAERKSPGRPRKYW